MRERAFREELGGPPPRCATMIWDYTLSLPLGALVGLASVAFFVGLVLH